MTLPPSLPLPTWVQTAYWLFKPLQMMDEGSARFGDAVFVKFAGVRHGGFVLLSDPGVVSELVALPTDQMSAGRANELWRPFFGDNSVTLLDGPALQSRRKVLMPPFHGERMRTYGATMLSIAGDSIDSLAPGRSFAPHKLFQDISLRIIIKTVFGVEDLRGDGELSRAIADMMSALTAVPGILSLPFLRRDYGRLSPWGRFLVHYRRIETFLRGEIERRRASEIKGDDILSMLLAARDEQGKPLTFHELRDDLVTLLMAGHETTATSLAWAVHWLLSTPAVHEELVRELDASLVDGALVPERVAKLDLLDGTVREALRLQPVVPIIGRILLKPTKLGGFELPAGMLVAASIYRLHRRPDIYDRPDEFRPARFLSRKPAANQWMPFGGGPKFCVGSAFAMYEMKMVLATLLTRTALRRASKRPVRVVRRLVTLAPSRAFELVPERRTPPASQAHAQVA